jgi:serine/threonine protein kinase
MVSERHPPIPSNISSTLSDLLLMCFKRKPTSRPKALDILSHPFFSSASGPAVPSQSPSAYDKSLLARSPSASQSPPPSAFASPSFTPSPSPMHAPSPRELGDVLAVSESKEKNRLNVVLIRHDIMRPGEDISGNNIAVSFPFFL